VPVPSGDRHDPPDQDVLRVALYSGVVFGHDAVSTSFLHKLRILTELRDSGLPIEVTGFTHASDFPDPDIHVVSGLTDLMRTSEFTAADVHVFEYTMWYELLNALFLIDRPSLVIDHNTTPVELINDPTVRLACARARHERHNLSRATHVAAVGEFTRHELLTMGFAADGVSVLHLPAATAVPVGSSIRRSRRPGDPLKLLYVGRFVRAKGVLDLLDAVEALWVDGKTDVTLTMAGSVRFPDTAVLNAVEEACAAHRGDGLLTMHVDLPDDEIAELYAASDVFVIPSHHEGFCVPVIEAMTSGCFVIGSDAGNIPYVMGGLGMLFPSGDSGALAVAIARYAEEITSAERADREPVLATSSGPLGLADWHERVARHLLDYGTDAYEAGFLRLLAAVLEKGPTPTAPPWLIAAARSSGTPSHVSDESSPGRTELSVPMR